MLILAPSPPRQQPNALLLSAAGTTKHIVFKVKAWDPSLHPKGYKGLFIETPDHDKKKATHANEGDVLATKSGKVFKVETQTPKGVKVNPVDPDTGEVKASYTVLSNDIDVAVLDKAKVPGSQHQIGDLEPGTYVKHPKSGKRFQISKHGNWTTIYPVDANGTVVGKHTVLPKDTVVEVVPKATTDNPSPKIISLTKELAKDLPDAGEPDPQSIAQLMKPEMKAWLAEHLGFDNPDDLDEQIELGIHTPTDWRNLFSDTWEAIYDEPPTEQQTLPFETQYQLTLKEAQDQWKQIAPGTKQPAWNPTADDVIADEAIRTWLLEQLALTAADGEGDLVGGYLGDLEHNYQLTQYGWNTFINDTHDPSAWSADLDALYAAFDVHMAAAIEKLKAQGPPKVEEHHAVESAVIENAVPAALNVVEFISQATQAELPKVLKNALTSHGDKWGEGLTGQDVAYEIAHYFEELNTESLAYVLSGDKYGHLSPKDATAQGIKDLAVVFDDLIALAKAKHAAALAPKSKPEQLEEIMPVKLPKVPQQYAPGVGPYTALVIDEAAQLNASLFTVRRVGKDGQTLEVLGDVDTVTKARALARGKSAPHESITETRSWVSHDLPSPKPEDYPINGYVIDSIGRVHRVKAAYYDVAAKYDGTPTQLLKVELEKPMSSGLAGAPELTTSTTPVRSNSSLVPLDPAAITDEAQFTEWFNTHPLPELGKTTYRRSMEAAGRVETVEQNKLRSARPEKYIAELQAEWSYDDLVGKPWVDAHKHMTPLGWREIKPRQKDRVRYVNKTGKRVTLLRDKEGWVTGVEQDQLVSAKIGATATGQALHQALAQALEDGADLADLDPRNAAVPEGRVSHVQHMIYDLAVGHRNGIHTKVAVAGAKVKTDDAYLQELESEGVVPDVTAFLDKVDTKLEFVQAKAKGSIIEQFGLQNSPDWDFPTRQFTLPDDLMTDEELGAAVAILSNQGVADQILGVNHLPDISPTFDPKLNPNNIAGVRKGQSVWKPDEATGEGLFESVVIDVQQDEDGNTTRFQLDSGWYNKNDDYVRYYGPESDPITIGAARLAAAWNDGGLANTKMDAQSRDHVGMAMAKGIQAASTLREAKQTAKYDAASNMRKQAAQDEVDKRRAAEGTVKEALAEFELPVWSQIELEPQTMAEVRARVDAAPVHSLSLPGGTAEVRPDVPAFYAGGVIRDGVVYYKSDRAEAKVLLEHDETITDRLTQMGGELGANRNPIDPGYSGSSKLYDGESIVVEEPGKTAMLAFDNWGNLDEPSHTRLEQAVVRHGGILPSSSYDWAVAANAIAKATPGTDEDKQAAIEKWIGESFSGSKGVDVWEAATTARGRYIEYVPHKQAAGNAGGAPTSQRGRVSLYGYTPEQAEQMLQQLGAVADLEPSVPYEIVMRGPRKHGLIAPILPAYIRGEGDLPSTPARITHGVTGGAALESILNTGGLLSIEQRYRAGFLEKLQTTSASGDIRSGIDHAVFCTIGLGGACGGGASVKIVMKPNAFLRRDIALAPNDYGASETRYAAYRAYLNGIQGMVGEATTNIYEPISPAVRQHHLDNVSTGASNEYNLGPTVPIEDIEAIGVPLEDVAQFDKLLDDMLASGEIASRPKILSGYGDETISQVAQQTTKKVTLGS